MKEQKIYEVTIIEVKEDIHDGSGVVKAINRKSLLHRKPVSAVSEESAKQQALASLKTKPDFDSLEITCSPFC